MSSLVDPITFEVIRHRLWSVNEEAAIALQLTSGSPVATESKDFNTGILTADGEVAMIGSFITVHAISLGITVKDILDNYKDNPGINEGDMFLCNDPYVGAIHQNDVELLAPIHYEGELIGWTGAIVHQVDVGSVGTGQVSLDAQSVFQESPLTPPVKIVERGVVRKDIEREYMRRSKLPDLLVLDFRAKVAANNVARSRIIDLVQKYGITTFKNTLEELLNFTENKFRARLKQLPDGEWRHTSYLDFRGKLYPVFLRLVKEDDRLHFDFSGTANQAPAVINCTFSGLLSAIMSCVFAYLCWDIPWSPAGILRAIEVTSEPGTVNNCSFPAGMCKATTAGNMVTRNVISACLAKMMDSSEQLRERCFAPWGGSYCLQELFGTDQRGKIFGTTLLDAMALGSGAYTQRDGLDSAGLLSSPSSALANVESLEARYPVMFVFRKHEPDTGGPGRFRGGCGLSIMWKPHGIDEIPAVGVHANAMTHTESVGLSGGFPGSNNPAQVIRRSNAAHLFREGVLPATLSDVSGEVQVLRGAETISLGKNDLLWYMTAGGGGYGDPLEREPNRVCEDIANGLVSLEAARSTYGVIVEAAEGCNFVVLENETETQRRLIAENRRCLTADAHGL